MEKKEPVRHPLPETDDLGHAFALLKFYDDTVDRLGNNYWEYAREQLLEEGWSGIELWPYDRWHGYIMCAILQALRGCARRMEHPQLGLSPTFRKVFLYEKNEASNEKQ